MATKKNVGYALYMETRLDEATSQAILIPSHMNTAKGSVENAVVLTRQISETNPRRSWKYYKTTAHAELGKAADITDATARSTSTLRELSPFFAGWSMGGWSFFEPKPGDTSMLVIELSQDDLNDLGTEKTPQALIRRIMRSREEAGFPDDLFVVTSTPSATL